MDDGGTAYPIISDKFGHWPGMSLRDYIAIRALEALMQMNGIQFSSRHKEHATEAYKQADAMIEARAERMEKANG